MATIRQEVSRLNEIVDITSTSYIEIEGSRVLIDPSKFSGSSTVYLEFLYSDSGEIFNYDFRYGATLVVGGSLPSVGATWTLKRVDITSGLEEGVQEYFMRALVSSGYHLYIKAVRIVRVQNSTPLTVTETCIEIGSKFSTNSTTATPGSAPKYWKYTSANWDGELAVYFEATFRSPSSKSSASVKLQVADGTGDGFTGWTDVSSYSNLVTNDIIATRVRSNLPITLIAGRNYRIVATSPTSKSAMTVYNASLVIQQTGVVDILQELGSLETYIHGEGQILVAVGQSFTPGSSYQLAGIDVLIGKDNLPTDDILVKVYSGSINGTLLATSNAINGAQIITTNVWQHFIFASPPSLVSGTKYYFQVVRTGSSTVHYYVLSRYQSSAYAGGGFYENISGTWGSESSTDDLYFRVFAAPITKLEPQYLIANATLAAGTALQTYLTKWDSTEWAGVTNAYYHAVDASNDNTSHVQLAQADGGGAVTNSAVEHPDNQGLSAAMTMPASENLDVQITTDGGSVYSSRILVAVVVVSSQIKKFLGIAQASLKVVMGQPIAHVKKLAGVSNS